MLAATMFCYLFYYTGRQNWGWVVRDLRLELGLSTTATGWIAGAALAAYGAGQAISGNLADRLGGRRLVSAGAVLSTFMSWATSFGNSFITLAIPWTANGFAQSLGWAPGSRLISNWWGHHERGRAFGFYVFAAGFSSVLTFALSITVLRFASWRWVFRLPVMLLFLAGVLYYFIARDRPAELGFALQEDGEAEDEPSTDSAVEGMRRRYLHTLSNPRFLVSCLGLGFESMARYGLLTWVPLHYLGPGWKQDPGSVYITLSLPVGMAFGALSGGYLSDRIFDANRSRPIMLYLVLAAVTAMTIYFVPRDNRLAGVVLLFLAGFFVYGPQSSFWALSPDLLGRSHAGTGVGILDACAYAFAAAQGPFYGWMIDALGSEAIFPLTAVICLLGACVMAFVRR